MKSKSNHRKISSGKSHTYKIPVSVQHAQEGQAPQAPKPGTNAQNQYR
jgi:hypothetical protein